MDESFNVVQARIVGAMEALAIVRSSGMDRGVDDSVALLSAETLLRRALRGLSDRFGLQERRPATGLLMDSVMLEAPLDDAACTLPFRAGPDRPRPFRHRQLTDRITLSDREAPGERAPSRPIVSRRCGPGRDGSEPGS